MWVGTSLRMCRGIEMQIRITSELQQFNCFKWLLKLSKCNQNGAKKVEHTKDWLGRSHS